MSFWNCFKLEKDKRAIVSTPTFEKGKENVKGGGDTVSFRFVFLVRERERLRSRFTDDPTVGIRRDKKQSDSTQRGLRVGTEFKSFDKLREVGVSSYSVFTLCLSAI